MSTYFTEKHFVTVIHDGLLKGVREKAISKIMESLEKDVTAAVDSTLKDMTGYVNYHYDHGRGEPVFQIMINKVPYKHETT